MTDRKSPYMRLLSWLLIFSLLNTTVGCYYYTYTRDNSPSAEKLDALKNSPNYIIVHSGAQAFNLSTVRVDQQAQTISGTTYPLSVDHSKNYLTTKPEPGSANRYKKTGINSTPYVINEVHLFIRDLELKEGESVLIPLASIEKVEVYDPDTGATTASHIFGGLGIVAAGILVIGIIILLTKSSCPFVYVNNGNEYVFAGEIFGGAIFKSIERDDYLLLPQINSEEQLELKVTNKLKEEQYINQLELIQVAHPLNTFVYPDRHGKIHHIQIVVSLSRAEVEEYNITSVLKQKDSASFSFNAQSGENFYNDVILTFPKSMDAREGHLILTSRNSLWGDYVFGEFTKLFGSNYNSWLKKQNEDTGRIPGKWAADQGLAMKVYVEHDGKWILSDTVDMIGPLAYRDLVVPLNLTDHHDQDLRIKLSSAFMMWELDYVAMDYSEDSGIEVTYFKPSKVIANTTAEGITSLSEADDNYLVQPNVGDEATVYFPVQNSKITNIKYDYVLHSRGYYNHMREYEGAPEVTKLLTFKRDGRFSEFSKEKYDEMVQLLQVAEISASIK